MNHSNPFFQQNNILGNNNPNFYNNFNNINPMIMQMNNMIGRANYPNAL